MSTPSLGPVPGPRDLRPAPSGAAAERSKWHTVDRRAPRKVHPSSSVFGALPLSSPSRVGWHRRRASDTVHAGPRRRTHAVAAIGRLAANAWGVLMRTA